MPSAPPPARRRPPGRYDEPSQARSRALAVALAAVFLVLLLAVVWTLFQRFGADRVPVQVRAFEVRGDDRVVVEFEATPPAGATVWCLVRSRGEAGEEVGYVFVPVRGAAQARPVRVRQELRTSARAVTGEVPRCLPDAPPAGEPTAPPAGP